MKRIQSACLYVTVRFLLEAGLDNEYARQKVLLEVFKYKESNKEKIRIVSEEKFPDGSVTLNIKKRVKGYPIGHYFD